MLIKSFRIIAVLVCTVCVPIGEAASQAKAPGVIVKKVASLDWSDVVEALGTLRANETVTLTATVTDTITSIHFDDGQRVTQGFVLAQMTDAEESALVTEASARVAEARRQFERVKSLPKSGAVSESLFDQRQREFRAAKAQLEAIESRLRDRLIVAPFAGVVGLRNISVGALVEPGDEIVTLTDDSIMKLDFGVPSVYLSKIETALPIEATSVAYPGRIFRGAVTSVDSRVDPVTRAIEVRATLPNPDRALKPGLLMEVKLEYHPRRVIIVPEEALVVSGNTHAVLRVETETNVVERRSVKVGSRRVGVVEITSGLEEGDVVITHGAIKARPGEKVEILGYQEQDQSISSLIESGAQSQ